MLRRGATTRAACLQSAAPERYERATLCGTAHGAITTPRPATPRKTDAKKTCGESDRLGSEALP